MKKYNIDPVKRLMRLAKESGVRHTVILGSYFAHFNKIWPDYNSQLDVCYVPGNS